MGIRVVAQYFKTNTRKVISPSKRIFNEECSSQDSRLGYNETLCFPANKRKPPSISVLLGAHNIKKPEKTQQQIPVLRAIRHKEYNNKNFNNDIMLLQLKKMARLNQDVGLLALPQKAVKVKPNQTCIVAGWGCTLKRLFSDTLQEVKLKVRRDYECKEKYRNHYNHSTQMCVGDPNVQKASFQGDSGGPLVCDGIAQGIVSYGFQNGSSPRVFTRISSFLPWIKRTMKTLEDKR
uniref:Granzyme B(G,H) n=1 Tax=Monodelphis domestica TaxID=13616 RepID=A0A5F8GA04_MONDO